MNSVLELLCGVINAKKVDDKSHLGDSVKCVLILSYIETLTHRNSVGLFRLMHDKEFSTCKEKFSSK